jgi:hypothetical protein
MIIINTTRAQCTMVVPWWCCLLGVATTRSSNSSGGGDIMRHQEVTRETNASVMAAAGGQYHWQLAYKTTSPVTEGDPAGLSEDNVKAAYLSCDEHHTVIRYDIGEKPYAYYRRLKQRSQDSKFNPFELMSECWKSKQDSGAGNELGVDFQIFSTEADTNARQPVWKFCNYDDCGSKVGFPRDCGPNGQVRDNWHMFKEGLTNGKSRVAFYVTTCNGWSPPLLEIDNGSLGWAFSLLVLLGTLGYCIAGAALNKRKGVKPTSDAWKLERAIGTQLPHRLFWRHTLALVHDGVAFARHKAGLDPGRARGAEGLSSHLQPTARGGNPAEPEFRTEKSQKGKRAKKKSSKKPGSKHKREGRVGTATPASAATCSEGPRWVGAAAGLDEQRDETVHSSQAKVTVVSRTDT